MVADLYYVSGWRKFVEFTGTTWCPGPAGAACDPIKFL